MTEKKKRKNGARDRSLAKVERERRELLLFVIRLIGLEWRPSVGIWRKVSASFFDIPERISKLIPKDGLYAIAARSVGSKGGVVHISGKKNPWESLCSVDMTDVGCRVVTPENWRRYVTCKRCRSSMKTLGPMGGKGA